MRSRLVDPGACRESLSGYDVRFSTDWSILGKGSAVYAIVEDSGTQIILREGEIMEVDLRGSESDSIVFDRVLAIKSDENAPAKLGTPYIEGASVTAEVLGQIKGEKIDVIKFKRRKGYKRKQGHRQPYLRIRVGEITG
ncbi:MAG: 50S ribosomal protein L21 [Phycisphaerales bacterium]|nr:50S ribosomal protein L21 [Phycisphaerales bacterium]